MSGDDLGEPGFWILTALAAGRRHGYAVLQEVRNASDGTAAVKPTTLYAALERLARQGLIAADGEEIIDGRARRYFVLTDHGTARLTREAEALEQRARVARLRLTAGLASAARPA